MAETTCPVFRPTEQEFKSFRRYIEDVVDPIAGKAGLCKIIPPPGEALSLFAFCWHHKHPRESWPCVLSLALYPFPRLPFSRFIAFMSAKRARACPG